nr:helicase-1 [Darna trima granulovirus]
MSVDDIMRSYESVCDTTPDVFSHQYLYFTNGAEIVRRHRRDVMFIIRMLHSANTKTHEWTMFPNYNNLIVVPYMPYEDYVNLSSVYDPQIFLFKDVCNKVVCSPKRYGNYMVWPKVSVSLLGWSMYLYVNCKYRLVNNIPLTHHQSFGDFTILTFNNIVLDIACKITQGNQVLFTNTDQRMLNFETAIKCETDNNQNEPIEVVLGTNYSIVHTTNLWFEFLINKDSITKCIFSNDYSYITNIIYMDTLRWIEGYSVVPNYDMSLSVENQHNVDDELQEENEKEFDDCYGFEITETFKYVTPSSTNEQTFIKIIDECYDYVNKTMPNFCSPTLNTPQVLNFYFEHSNYATFYIFVINVWQYCEMFLDGNKKEKIEDYLMFVKLICMKFEKGRELFTDFMSYMYSYRLAKNFMNSLIFFNTPQQGIELFFSSTIAYFSLHLCIFENTGSWNITVKSIGESKTPLSVQSMGFFKKIKSAKHDYIFNGHVYEYYKNAKDHVLAADFIGCPEIAVPELIFNKTTIFYITQDGVFDACKKVYRHICPFIVMSSLKKTYISKNQKYIEKDVFHKLINTTEVDLSMLKMYHARKFLDNYTSIVKNINDCDVIGDKLKRIKHSLITEWRKLIDWVLNALGTDILIMILKLKEKFAQPIVNILSLSLDVDLYGLRAAFVCHLIYQNNSKIETFLWALLCPNFQDFEDWLEGDEFDDLINVSVFQNKKKIFESVMLYLHKLNYGENFSVDKLRDLIKSISFSVNKAYDSKRVFKCVGMYYRKYDRLSRECNVWSDTQLEAKKTDTTYTWLVRFYVRMFFRKYDKDLDRFLDVVKGYVYFRLFTNFHRINSKVVYNFCAALAIPFDYEKMCLILTSPSNSGKSSLWDMLNTLVISYKKDRGTYKQNTDKDDKIKTYESQLYVLNEASMFTKEFIKSMIDSSKIESARCIYGVVEKFNGTFKMLICNNTDDKICVQYGFDDACSNRLGQIYMDHKFELKKFNGSVYEHYMLKNYCAENNLTAELRDSVSAFLANVLVYNCNPNDGYMYYKDILNDDPTYKHNKMCLYVYNNRLSALCYVMKIKLCKDAPEFSEEQLLQSITNAEQYVKQMLHPLKTKHLTASMLFSDFGSTFKSQFNADTKIYFGINIALNENQFNKYQPNLKATIEDDV